MGSIDVIGSQLDVASIVSQLMQLERLPVYRMEDQITAMQKKVSAYQTLNTRLSTLANSVNMMLYGTTTAPYLKPGTFDQRMVSSVFNSRTVVSSNDNVLTATASGTSITASSSYSLTVSQLAQAQTSVSKGFTDTNYEIGPFNGTISIGGKTISIELNNNAQPKIMASGVFDNATDTIEGLGEIALSVNGSSHRIDLTDADAPKTWIDVRDEINAISGVTAEIITDTETGKYRLQITADDPGTAGAFTISAGGDEDFVNNVSFAQTQAAKNNPTIRDLQQAISEAASREGLGINASIINAGAYSDGGAIGGYRLMITSKETGEANAFTFGGDFNDGIRFNFDNTQTAQDARMTINGITINSSSNVVKDAIEGVNITLKNTTKDGETITLNLGVDEDAIVSAVKDMISAYNAVTSYINSQFNYSATTTTDSLGRQQTSVTGGTLAGDATLRSVQSSLQSIISGGILSGENVAYKAIGQVGLSYDKGVLTLDEAKLKEALSKDFDAVAGFFLGYDKTVDDGYGGEQTVRVGGILTNMGESLKGLTDPLRNPIKNAMDGLDSTIRGIQQSIETYELRLQMTEDRLYAQFSAADQALRLMRVTLGNITGALASLTNNNN